MSKRKRSTYLLAATAVVAAALVALLAVASLSNNWPGDETREQVTIAASFSVSNADKLGIEVEPDSGAIYAAFYRTRNGVTNTYLIRSEDEAKTFSEPVRVNATKGNAAEVWYPVSLAFSPAGAIYVAWAIKDEEVVHKWGSGVRDFKIAKSTDGGMSFGQTVRPGSDPLRNGLSVTRTFFDLAVSNKGTVFASHLALGIKATNGVASYTGRGSMRVFRSLDNGKSFDEFVLDAPTCVCCHTKAVASPSGEVYFSWRSLEKTSAKKGSSAYHFENNSVDTARDIFIASTIDGGIGNDYSEPQRIPAKHWFINGCPSSGAGIDIDDRGRIHAAYFTGSDAAKDGIGYYYAYSNDNGTAFTRIPLLTADYIPLVHQGTSLAVDEKGNTWVTFITPNLTSDESEQKVNYHGNKAVVHLYVIGDKANIVAMDKFETDTIMQPVVASASGTTVLAYAEGDGYKIYSLSLTSDENVTKQ